MTYMIRMSYGGTKKQTHRFFGSWTKEADAQEVADRWINGVCSHFFGVVTFAVVRLESRKVSMRQVREELREAGMN